MGGPGAWGPMGGPGAWASRTHGPQGPMGLKDPGLKDPGPPGGPRGVPPRVFTLGDSSGPRNCRTTLNRAIRQSKKPNLAGTYTLYLIPTFAGHKSSSYSSYEDDIDTNRILTQKSTILKRQTIKISCLR